MSVFDYDVSIFSVIGQIFTHTLQLKTSTIKLNMDKRLTKMYGDQAHSVVFAKAVEKFGIELEKAYRP